MPVLYGLVDENDKPATSKHHGLSPQRQQLMDAFLIKKKRKLSHTNITGNVGCNEHHTTDNVERDHRCHDLGQTKQQKQQQQQQVQSQSQSQSQSEVQLKQQHDADLDSKLAILSSVFEDQSTSVLLQALLVNDGSIERATNSLLLHDSNTREIERISATRNLKSTPRTPGIQSSIAHLAGSRAYRSVNSDSSLDRISTTVLSVPRPSIRKGQTLTLYDPISIAALTPCTIIHNFLPTQLANDLLAELLPETTTYASLPLKVFDNIVRSPHTACFYVDDRTNPAFLARRDEYLYNGSSLGDVRPLLPVMRQVQAQVQRAVNEQIQQRIATHYPRGQKLRYMSSAQWEPNAAFVNCYDGAKSSVGYHTDQLTYLGPHPVIGSLSLGVQREFRIRQIVTKTEEDTPGRSNEAKKKQKEKTKTLEDVSEAADVMGQISIPLPHNSLLIMHAEMQEAWKHAVVPASSATGGITPHPLSDRKRINITYRWYRPEFGPEMTPSCRCGVKCVLKYVRGKYCWICQTPGRVVTNEDGSLSAVGDGKGCGWFGMAEFDDEGRPAQGKNLSARLGQFT